MNIRLGQRLIPKPVREEILLQVAAATTCGTDVKTLRRGHPVLLRLTHAGFGHKQGIKYALILPAFAQELTTPVAPA